jgi:hypothetical protein
MLRRDGIRSGSVCYGRAIAIETEFRNVQDGPDGSANGLQAIAVKAARFHAIENGI